jgi:hypothetical protein
VRNVKQAFVFTSVNEAQSHEGAGRRTYQIHRFLNVTLHKHFTAKGHTHYCGLVRGPQAEKLLKW